jgi:hypothetical protein
MKRDLFIAVALILLANAFAIGQITPAKKTELRAEIGRVSATLTSLKESNNELQRTVSAQRKQIDDLSAQLAESQAGIKKLAESTNVSVSQISLENRGTQSRLQAIDQSITKRTLYWTVIVLSISVLGIVALVFLRRGLISNARDFDTKIATHKQALEKLQIGANKQDAELAEILRSQLEVLSGHRSAEERTPVEKNHRLPLKVGDEIHRMRKRIQNMPQDIKGLGALRNSLARLEEEFNEQGYEIEDLLGKKYVDGMKVEARFVENPNIPPGQEIITEVIRPQIEFKGELIQPAKVEVGKSY